METRFDDEVEEPEPTDELSDKKRFERKEKLLQECVQLLDKSGRICNPSKLLTDLTNRERKATTGIGNGIAIPHVRTMQAREFVIGMCRSTEGYDFDAVDSNPVHLFVPMAAPPYDDNLYLRVFKSLAELFRYDSFMDKVMEAQAPYDIVLAIKEFE
jgi:mannitol/fructose-specific phosphotransferase system IIA component (Ntr-type)